MRTTAYASLIHTILAGQRNSPRILEGVVPLHLSIQPSFPILGNVERPLKFQMCMIVIIDELGDSFVVTPRQHT